MRWMTKKINSFYSMIQFTKFWDNNDYHLRLCTVGFKATIDFAKTVIPF